MRSFPFGMLSVLGVVAAVGTSCVGAVKYGPWPATSGGPVAPLEHPSLDDHVNALALEPGAPTRLVVFGDQRALADGEWQAMNELIARREQLRRNSPPLLAIVDTGDIVFDGSRRDQFAMLNTILTPLRSTPYLVGVGNHEVRNNLPGPARENLVQYLSPTLGEDFTVDRMYYRRDVAGVRMLFLDTNDLVYGPDGDFESVDGLTYRGRAQLRWLAEELADSNGIHTTIAVLHHPLVVSSEKHRAHSAKLWSLAYEGRTLPEILAEGGVDLVLTGHTHTYERFRLTAPSGQSFQLINVSGRPRALFWRFGRAERMAQDIAGRETQYLLGQGWRDLEGWQIEQLDAMLGHGANQWLELHLLGEGRVEAEVFYLVDEGRGGARSDGRFELD